jgi:hypothetical protein
LILRCASDEVYGVYFQPYTIPYYFIHPVAAQRGSSLHPTTQRRRKSQEKVERVLVGGDEELLSFTPASELRGRIRKMLMVRVERE